MKTSEVLQRARALIADRSDWCKYSSGILGGPRCAQGALWQTMGSDGEHLQFMNEMAQAESDYDYLFMFNDATETRHSDVLRLYDLAISAAMSDEAAK